MAGRTRVALVAATVLPWLALTGCLSPSDAPADAAIDPAANETGPELPPDNRSGDFAAFRETNATEDGAAGRAHDHDYWAGRSRVTLFREEATMNPSPDDEGRAFVVFRLPRPALVYERTGTVEVTITEPRRHACNPTFSFNGEFVCTPAVGDPLDAPPLELALLHGASDPNDWNAAGVLAWNQPYAIDVQTPTWTDMPHSTGSLWAFRIASTQALDVTLVFDISVDIVRGVGDVPAWPGHPDFYRDGHVRKVFEGPGEVSDGDGQGLRSIAQPSKLISYGTRSLHVWANITNVESGPVAPTHWYLYFHNASYTTWNSTSPFDANFTSDRTSLYWVIPVGDDGMDSPYASVSRWEFMVRGAFSTPVISCVGGCRFPYKVAYDLTMVATDVVEETYHPTRQA